MCRPLLLFIFQVLILKCVTASPYGDYILAYIPIQEFPYLKSAGIEAILLPFYGNIVMNADPRALESMLWDRFLSSYIPYKGPVSFGGPINAKGSVNVYGGFGTQGYGTFTSYSAPPTPIYVTSHLTLPIVTSLPTVTKLPNVTTLPAITVPSSERVVSVPLQPMPAARPITSRKPNMPVDNPVKFSGMVPASGRVKICATFC